MKKIILLASMAALTLGACNQNQKQEEPQLTKSGLDPARFETTVDGVQTHLYTLTNKNGVEACITNFGGRIVSLLVPDKNGEWQDVEMGFDNVEDYMNVPSDFGATIGRYANRIGNATFELDGEKIELIANNGPHCLHGGPKGWQYKAFNANQTDGQTLELTLTSPDGDMNFPGTVSVKVVMHLTDDNALSIDYTATTDKKTIINMTNHSYFNLSGDPRNSAMDNVLMVNGDGMTPIDDTFATTGEIVPVEGTPFDFRQPEVISARINQTDNAQIVNGGGIDHNWVLNTRGDVSQVAASLLCPQTGIKLEVFTNEPGIQVYCGNFLNGTVTGKKGITYAKRTAVCLETQKYPDTPNKPQWPTAVLEPGQTYHSQCVYKFSVEQ